MAYLESILLGFSLAAIPGPIFFEVLRRTLTKGFWSGALLSIGEFFANLLILTITFFGMQNFLSYLPVKLTLFLLGSIILSWIGISAINMKAEYIKKSEKNEIYGNNSILVGFWLGIASPLTIAVWISIGGAYLAQYTSKLVSWINIILLLTGVIIFFFTFAFIIHIMRHKISTRNIILFSKFFGIIILSYALYFLYQIFRILIND